MWRRTSYALRLAAGRVLLWLILPAFFERMALETFKAAIASQAGATDGQKPTNNLHDHPTEGLQ